MGDVMGEREQRLVAAGYPLDRGPKEGPVIDLLSVLGDTLYASGQVPYDAGVLTSKGKVPSQVSVENATTAAGLCAANILRAIITKLGSLDKIERVVRVTGYVNADPDFTECHMVINGATNLLKEVFGPEAGRHARTALGMGQLPLGTSVEVEAIFQLKK
jgi:enamine deaminase RidA (YjgF/YER057c/UK114 family)